MPYEYDLFTEIRTKIAGTYVRIQEYGQKAVASLDVFASLSYIAEMNRFVNQRSTKKGYY